jgi:hypothetical protein
MELRDMFISTMAGAAVVLMGAFYALFYALGRLHNHRIALAASATSYLGLAVATFMLVDALALRGFWLFVAATMLIGYLLAPMAIWRLSVDIHDDHDAEATERTASVPILIKRTDQ